MKTTLSIISTDVSTGKTSSKSYGNIVPGYVGVIGGSAPAVPYKPTDGGTQRYDDFAQWAFNVASGINQLSTDTYSDCTIACSVSINEEMAG